MFAEQQRILSVDVTPINSVQYCNVEAPAGVTD